MLAKPRSVRKLLFALLALFMVLTAAQIGPLAPSALAVSDARKFCPYPGATEQETLEDGVIVEWICVARNKGLSDEYWEWEYSKTIYPSKPSNDEKTLWFGGASSPPYKMTLQAGLGKGRGGGDATGSVTIFTSDYTNLDRRIAARTVMQVYSSVGGWSGCHDTGWEEASTQRSWMKAFVAQYVQPDCGAAWYRVLAAGRFYSVTTSSWITRGWIVSPEMYLSFSTNPTEPTYVPTPTPDTPA